MDGGEIIRHARGLRLKKMRHQLKQKFKPVPVDIGE